MSDVFDAYAAYYDLLYSDKDYSGEAEYLDALVKGLAPHARELLELGCGTGTHASYLAKLGYTVHGIDASDAMLARANKASAALPGEVSANLSFEFGDVRHWRGNRLFDVALSLFHVFSYQVTDEDVRAAFTTASMHLRKGGLLIFDFWHGPAVRAIQPEQRTRELENDDIQLTRRAKPESFPDQNRVNVHYEITVENRHTGDRTQFHEIHRMRYFFEPELEHFLQQAGFELLCMCEWLGDSRPTEASWGAVIVARYLG